MAGPKLFDRVKDTSTTTGTGTLTLANSAPTGFRTFGSVLSNSDTCFYAIASSGGSEWEVGIGTYTTSGTTLARTTVLASSNAGAAVNLSAGTKDVFIPTPAQVQNYLYNPTNTVANLTSYMAGRVGFPSNGFSLLRDTGSAMDHWGPIFPFTEPISGDFSWVNQGSATISTTNGGIYLEAPSNSVASSVRGRFKTAPTAPWVISTAFLQNQDIQSGSYGFAGVGFRDSGSGKLICPWYEWNSATALVKFRVYKMDAPGTPNADYTSGLQGPFPSIGQLVFMQIGDDNTNLYCKVSADGQNWIQVWSAARTNFLATPNSVGFYVNPYAAITSMTLLHWKES